MTVDRRRGATSLVLCTMNRPGGAAVAVRSMLRAGCVDEIIVVDQGDQPLSLEAFPVAPPVQLLREQPRGLAAARNAGVRAARGEYVLFTDDDCEVDPGWVDGFHAAFALDERIGMVFGTVAAAEYDRTKGFVPAYRVKALFVADRLSRKHLIEGMGACMAIRRSVWEALGGFDEALGSGGRFKAGEDTDFAIRALAAGWHVAETPAAIVRHHGFRTWQEGQRLIEGYMYGLGATNMKLLRVSGWRAVRPLAELSWRWLAGAPVVDLNHRPPRLARLVAFLRGARDGLRLPVDRTTGRFLTGS